MAFKRARARILERSTTAGSGPWSLAGAVDGSYNTFSSFLANGDQTYGSIVEPGVAFATGILTYGASNNSVTLTDVEETKGTFGSGTKEIFASPLASTNMFAQDISGAIVTGGTSTAYTVASNRGYDTLNHLDGALIAFTVHVTNGAGPVLLSVDGLSSRPLRAAPGVDLLAGVLIQGTPYAAVFNRAANEFYLHGLFGNPFNVPLGVGLEYWLPTVPNSCFIFPAGQALSRTTYATLFGQMGTQYGSGDGSTTFNVPDKRGRLSGAVDNLNGGTRASRLTSTTIPTGGGGTGLGDTGGTQTNALSSTNQLPQFTPSGSVSVTLAATIPVQGTFGGAEVTDHVLFGSNNGPGQTLPVSFTTNSAGFTGNAIGSASPSAFNIIPPLILCNYIMRVL
jgi:microcystin-dependent protein